METSVLTKPRRSKTSPRNTAATIKAKAELVRSIADLVRAVGELLAKVLPPVLLIIGLSGDQHSGASTRSADVVASVPLGGRAGRCLHLGEVEGRDIRLLT